MSRKNCTLSPALPGRFYWGADVPMRVIRRFARQVAKRFQPDKIILFGSHAYGRPHADSDVDILVIMPCRNQLDQAVKISLAIDPPFPLDIIIRTPHKLARRLKQGDWFLREVARCCMQQLTAEWVDKAEKDYRAAVLLAIGDGDSRVTCGALDLASPCNKGTITRLESF
jgi:predicted nucleotidyltransferase